MTINSDINHLIKELKEYNRGYYISSLFIKKKYFYSAVLFIYFDMELIKTVLNSSEKNIILNKFVWWRNYLISTNKNHVPNVPFFRVYYHVYKQNKLVLNTYLKLIDDAEKLYSLGGISFKSIAYVKYVFRRNIAIKILLDSNFKDRRSNKALNLAVIAQYYRLINQIDISKDILKRAKKFNRRPDKENMFIYMLHKDYTGLNLIKNIILALFRIW